MAPQRLSEASRRALLTLRGADGVSDDDIHHLTAVATTSPQITHQLNTTTQTGNLRGFAVQPADINAGASYRETPPNRPITTPVQPPPRGRHHRH